LVKSEIFVKNQKVGHKSTFWSKTEILVKNRNVGQKSKFWSKIDVYVKNRNLGQTAQDTTGITMILQEYTQISNSYV